MPNFFINVYEYFIVTIKIQKRRARRSETCPYMQFDQDILAVFQNRIAFYCENNRQVHRCQSKDILHIGACALVVFSLLCPNGPCQCVPVRVFRLPEGCGTGFASGVASVLDVESSFFRSLLSGAEPASCAARTVCTDSLSYTAWLWRADRVRCRSHRAKKKNARICILTFSLMASWRPQADLNRR